MPRAVSLVLVAALALQPLAALACDQRLPPGFDDDLPEGASLSVGRLTDRQWELQTMDGDPVPDTAEVWLTITPDGAVSGRAGCNRYVGRAELDAGVLVFGSLATTQMACDERTMELEAAYLKALGEARGFVVSPEGLWLTREDGSAAVCLG